jgi:hypothetical protein
MKKKEWKDGDRHDLAGPDTQEKKKANENEGAVRQDP